MTEAKATAGCFSLASTKVVVHDSWKIQYVQRPHRKEDPWLLNSTSPSSRKVMSVPRNSCTCTWACVHTKSLQSCLILCDPMNCSLPGSSAQEISQARILEWFAMPSSRESSGPRDQTHVLHWQSSSLPLVPRTSQRATNVLIIQLPHCDLRSKVSILNFLLHLSYTMCFFPSFMHQDIEIPLHLGAFQALIQPTKA